MKTAPSLLSIALSLLLCLVIAPSCAQVPAPKDIAAEIEAVENGLAGRVQVEGERTWNIYERMSYYRVPGVSIAVMQDHKVVWAKGYGWADEKSRRPVTENTIFHVASVSKSINAMGVLKLAQDKKIDLDKDINTYLTSWKFPYDSVSKGKVITTASLLSHTAGLSNSGPMYSPYEPHPTIVQELKGEKPGQGPAVRAIFEPGLRSEYSNPGIGITQLLVMDVAKMPFAQYVHETVFKPLGMTNSIYTEADLQARQLQLATGYREGDPLPGRRVVVPMSAAGGLWTTPTDLCKFIAAIQLAYAGKSEKVLNQAMVKRMLTPVADPIAALGVFIEEHGGTKYFSHSGLVKGFKSIYYGSLEGGDGVVVLINTNDQSELITEIVNSVAAVYQWKGFYQPIVKKAVPAPDGMLPKLAGIYMAEPNRFTHVLERTDGYYLFVDGAYSKIVFSSPTDFFNLDFPTEKRILTDAAGNVTGYVRTLNGQTLPQHTKVTNVDTLQGSEEFFSNVGWNLLENRNYDAAVSYFKRGLALYPNGLFLQCNLAHAHLFRNEYDSAIRLYKAHLGEKLTDNLTWDEMLRNDFEFFNNLGFDRKLMDRVLAETGIAPSTKYQANN